MADDLHQAIQAAATALHRSGIHQNVVSCNCTLIAQTTVQEAAPVLLQTLQGHILDITDKQMDACLAGRLDALEQLQDLRDQHADLQVYAADLRLLIEDAVGYVEAEAGWGDDTAERMRAVLQTHGPERGRAILDQVERYRAIERTAREFLAVVDTGSWGQLISAGMELQAALDLEAAPEEVGR